MVRFYYNFTHTSLLTKLSQSKHVLIFKSRSPVEKDFGRVAGTSKTGESKVRRKHAETTERGNHAKTEVDERQDVFELVAKLEARHAPVAVVCVALPTVPHRLGGFIVAADTRLVEEAYLADEVSGQVRDVVRTTHTGSHVQNGL